MVLLVRKCQMCAYLVEDSVRYRWLNLECEILGILSRVAVGKMCVMKVSYTDWSHPTCRRKSNMHSEPNPSVSDLTEHLTVFPGYGFKPSQTTCLLWINDYEYRRIYPHTNCTISSFWRHAVPPLLWALSLYYLLSVVCTIYSQTYGS